MWEAYAEVLRDQGYSVVMGIMHAEQYGVPQTRKRAILIARQDGGEVKFPGPTHSKYHTRDPYRLDPGVKPSTPVGTPRPAGSAQQIRRRRRSPRRPTGTVG